MTKWLKVALALVLVSAVIVGVAIYASSGVTRNASSSRKAAGSGDIANRPAPAVTAAKVEAESVPVTDIVTWFNDYYRYASADIDSHFERYLPVIANALTVKASAQAVLRDPDLARVEALDHAIGYLSVGGANDDSELTMATYRSQDGGEVLVVDSTICVDDCDIHVEVFSRNEAGDLVLRPTRQIFPPLNARDFVTPGEVMPKEFAAITPSLRYRPMPNGQDVEVSTWFGAQAEEDHERWAPDDAGAMTTLTLRWDAVLGTFVHV